MQCLSRAFKEILFYVVVTRLMDPQPNQKPVKLCPMLVAVKMVSLSWLKRVIKFSTVVFLFFVSTKSAYIRL